jgi:6-phosphofructokinase
MKIAIVTGGGDCPGLNTVIRATVKAATYQGWESFGIYGSYSGLLEPAVVHPLRRLRRRNDCTGGIRKNGVPAS